MDVPQELSRVLLASVPSMLAYFDRGLRCRFANASCARALGVTPEDAVGRSLDELLGPQELGLHGAPLARVLAGQRQQFEHSVEESGVARRLLVTCIPDEADGQVRGFVTEVTDITPLRAAEEAHRNSEARFRTLSESSPLGVYLTDSQGRRLYMNPRWQEIYGLPDRLGRGDGWMQVLHEDDRHSVEHAWKEAIARGTELDLTFRIHRSSDDKTRVVRTRARPVKDQDGTMIGLVGVLEDITERNADEQSLRASEAFLDRTGRVARIGGWEVDLRTRQSRWSAQTRRICEVDDDYRPPYLGGHSFYPPDAWLQLSSALEQALAGGHAWDLELPFVSAKGRHLWVRVLGEVELEQGVPVRLVGAIQDVTEQRRQQAALRRERTLRQDSERHAVELDRLLGERSEMLDVMAHEVRQPLNNASAALQRAMTELAEMGSQQAAAPLSRAQAVLGRVISSIDNTLAVASLLARPDRLQCVDTDIDTLLAVSCGDMPRHERSRIVIERATQTRTAPMDMSLMRLAIRNLLSNALRCSPAGSSVRVRVDDIDEPPGLLIEVINDGDPIPDEQLARLFKRSGTRQRAHGQATHGMGLGLYIVRRVLELHGGHADLVRNEAGSIVFSLSLFFQQP